MVGGRRRHWRTATSSSVTYAARIGTLDFFAGHFPIPSNDFLRGRDLVEDKNVSFLVPMPTLAVTVENLSDFTEPGLSLYVDHSWVRGVWRRAMERLERVNRSERIRMSFDESYNATEGFYFYPGLGNESRKRLSAFCRSYALGAFDCAKSHNIVEDLATERGSSLSPEGYKGQSCNAAQRGHQRLVFLSKFPEGALDPGNARGSVKHEYYDKNSLAWPFSGAFERYSWKTLVSDIIEDEEDLEEDGRGRRRRTLIDVGANKGNFSANVISLVDESRTSALPLWAVHMFEPDSGFFGLLNERVVEWNGLDSVSIENLAVSDKVSEAEPMFFPDRSKNNGVQPHPYGALSEHVFWWKRGGAVISRDVRVTTLDEHFRDYNETLDILKVDVEGYEPAVLRGAEGLLRKGMIGTILFEYGHCWSGSGAVWDTSMVNLGTTVQWLDSLGFDCYLIGGENEELLRLTGGCWVSDYETWSWSNILAVSRSVRPKLSAKWAAKARPKKGDGGRALCEVVVWSAEGEEMRLAAPKSGEPEDWRKAVESFAKKHDFNSHGTCINNFSCVVDMLLELLYKTCSDHAA